MSIRGPSFCVLCGYSDSTVRLETCRAIGLAKAESEAALRDFSVAREADYAHRPCMSQSIRNRIPGIIREITSDPVLSEVVLDTKIGSVAAVITTRSVNELGLKVGDSVYALVKATNVSVEKA